MAHKLETEPCRFCGAPPPHRVDARQDMHGGGGVVCTACGRTLGFLPKSADDPTKYRRPNEHRELVSRFGKGYCELCLRLEVELKGRQGLVGHHVLPFQSDGEAKRENVWILCTACHRIVEWMRTYHGNTEMESPA